MNAAISKITTKGTRREYLTYKLIKKEKWNEIIQKKWEKKEHWTGGTPM